MPQPSLSRAEHRRRWDAYIINGSDRPRAALALGIPAGTMNSWLHRVHAEHGPNGPPAEWFTDEPTPPEIIPSPPQKPVVRVKAVTHEAPPDGPIRRVVAIGDLHQEPGRDVERFKWIGRLVAERRPDNVVQIGDLGSFNSLSSHEKPGSRKFYERGNFADDLDCVDEALSVYHREIGVGEIPHDITFGNHEDRAWRAENESPNLAGSLVLPIEQMLARYRWRTHEYGRWLFLDGVGFSHVPFTIMGKPYRGRHPNSIGNDATYSLVWGDSHRGGVWTFPKIGPQNRVTLVNLGTALPHGTVEGYAGVAMTGWTWGVYELRLQAGRIIDHSFHSMLTLEERYG